MSFEAHDYPAYQLFTRRCYGTPRNQRQYVWNRRNWQELFDDVILVATQKEPTHFIGSIVLYREKDRKNGVSYFTIVDGQQRIISLTIFLASIAFWLRCHEADNEFHGTRQYLFTRDDSNNESIVIKSEQYLSLERIVCGIFSASVNKIQNYDIAALVKRYACNGVQREHNKKLNNGLPILHKVPPKRDYGRYFCIMAEKGGTSHGGLTEKLSLFFHAKKQEVNAYGR